MHRKKPTIDPLEARILAAAVRPMTYAEIAEALHWPDADPAYKLARTLARMAAAGRIYYDAPRVFSVAWPVYSAVPIPKKFKLPSKLGKRAPKIEEEETV